MGNRAKPEEIIAKLREVEVHLARGETTEASRACDRCDRADPLPLAG